MIEIAFADRIVAVLDVAVVGGEIERHPAAFVGQVRIGAVIEQIRAELVVPVLRRDEQRGPAVAGRLIDVRAGRQQHLHRLEIVGARRDDERRQLPAVFRRRSAAAKRRNEGVVVLIGAVGVSARPAGSSAAAATASCASSRSGGRASAADPAELSQARCRLSGRNRRAERRHGAPGIV